MVRIIVLAIVLCIYFVSNAKAGLDFVGTLDSKKENFYYTGGDVLSWSRFKAKEYQSKSNLIFEFNFERNEQKIVYTGASSLSRVRMSPNNEYIGVYSTKDKSVIIFNKNWEQAAVIKDNVYEFVWHPDSNKIVYVTGEKSIRKSAYKMALKPDGVWLYDIAEDKKEKLRVLGKHARLGQKDRKLYLWNGEKWEKYDFETGKITETIMTMENVDYSPDGKYYMDASGMDFEPPYWSPFRIYDAANNQELPVEKIGFISERNPSDYIWGYGGKIIFDGMTARTDATNKLYIYDFANRKLIRQFNGTIAGHSDDLESLVVYRDGKFYLEKF